VRLPGQGWGLRNGEQNYYHPDEDRLLRNAYEIYSGRRPSDFYPFGYSLQVGAVARVAGVDAEDSSDLLPVGRAVSLFYGVLTVLLVWMLAAELGIRSSSRWIPAACYAMAGLPVIYSHYATADTTLAFFFAATVFAALKAFQKRELRWVFLCSVLCGVAMGTKLPLVLLVPVIAASLRARRWWLGLALSIVTVPLTAQATCLFAYDLSRFRKLLHMVRTDNVGVVAVHDYLANPLVLAFELLPCVGLVVAVLLLGGALRALLRLLRGGGEAVKRAAPVFWCMVLPGILWFASVCMMPIPFPRHILPLLPLLVLLSAVGLKAGGKRTTVVVLLCVIYQAVYLLPLEAQYVTDTREKMEGWLRENVAEGSRVYRCWYSQMRNWDDGLLRRGDISRSPYVLMHEAFYRRYIRSPVNPFRSYPREERVYHSFGHTARIQRVLREDGYEELKRFPVRYLTPELILYKSLLGSFPDFAGDTVLYRKL